MTTSNTNRAAALSRVCSRSPLYFLCLTILIQCVAAGLTVLALRALKMAAADLPFPIFIGAGLVLYGVIAWAVAAFLDLPPLWRLFNVLLLPGVAAMQELDLPHEVYPIAVFAALLLYLPTLWTRVPYYPSSQAMYEAVLSQLPQGKTIAFTDLGCGFAGLLCFLAKARPESRFVGVELSPLAYLISKINVLLHGAANAHIQYKNIWSVPLEEYNVVYAFLAPPPMAALWEKVKAELPPGGIFLVNSFAVPGVRAEEITVPGKRQVILYRYDI